MITHRPEWKKGIPGEEEASRVQATGTPSTRRAAATV